MSQNNDQSNPWKWVAIILLVVMVGGPCVCIGAGSLLGGVAVSKLTNTLEPFIKASMLLNEDEVISEHLGTPFKENDREPEGDFDLDDDGAFADLSIVIEGQKNDGTLIIKAKKEGDGDWVYEKLVVETTKDGQPATYDLLSKSWQ